MSNHKWKMIHFFSISELNEYVHFSKAFKGHKNKNVPLGKISTHCEIRTAQQCNCLPRPSGLK